jgi:hypothetical protein
MQAKKSCEIGVGEIGVPKNESATLFVSPGVDSLASRDFARISIFATFLDPLKLAEHALWKLLLFIQPSAVVL